MFKVTFQTSSICKRSSIFSQSGKKNGTGSTEMIINFGVQMIIGMFKHTFAHHLTAMLLSNTSSSSLHSLLAAFGRYEGREIPGAW